MNDPDYDEFPPHRKLITCKLLDLAQAHRLFPEAMVKFDWQCAEIHGADEISFRVGKKNRRAVRTGFHVDARWLSQPPHLVTSRHWHPEAGVWVRSCHGVCSYPRRTWLQSTADRAGRVVVGREIDVVLQEYEMIELHWSDLGRPGIDATNSQDPWHVHHRKMAEWARARAVAVDPGWPAACTEVPA